MRRAAGPTRCCGCRSAGAPGWRNKSGAGYPRPKSSIGTSDRAASPGPCVAPLQRATLVFTHAAPDAGVLTGIQRPRQALRGHRTAVADQLRLRDLRKRRPAVSHWEKQLRILIATDRLVA